MAVKKSINKSSRRRVAKKSARQKNALTDKLEFPDGAGFVSRRGRMGIDAMLKLCEERLPWFNSRPGAQERRLREKCHVEFML